MASNNNQSARSFQLEFKEMLETVFGSTSYFGDLFAGGLETIDGITEKDNAFYVKTTDTPVVINTYDTGANVAMGDGTGKGSRFGNRTEIIYSNTPAPYTWTWAYHEGIDRHTVNNDFEGAIADRLEAQAKAMTVKANVAHGKFISDNAGITVAEKSDVKDTFNELAKAFTNNGVIGTRVAKVTPDVWNAIIDSGLAVTGKNSSANIDDNTITSFKGFRLEQVPESVFQSGDIVYAYAEGAAKAFTGIQTARTIESEDFDGVALQGAGKAGEFILDDNKAALAKVTAAGA